MSSCSPFHQHTAGALPYRKEALSTERFQSWVEHLALGIAGSQMNICGMGCRDGSVCHVLTTPKSEFRSPESL